MKNKFKKDCIDHFCRLFYIAGLLFFVIGIILFSPYILFFSLNLGFLGYVSDLYSTSRRGYFQFAEAVEKHLNSIDKRLSKLSNIKRSIKKKGG